MDATAHRVVLGPGSLTCKRWFSRTWDYRPHDSQLLLGNLCTTSSHLRPKKETRMHGECWTTSSFEDANLLIALVTSSISQEISTRVPFFTGTRRRPFGPVVSASRMSLRTLNDGSVFSNCSQSALQVLEGGTQPCAAVVQKQKDRFLDRILSAPPEAVQKGKHAVTSWMHVSNCVHKRCHC